MDSSRYLFTDLKDESRRIRPSSFFMMRCLLYSRLETGLVTSQECMDEDVNVYLAHLLNTFTDPAHMEQARQYLHRYDHEVFRRLERSTDARLKYTIYKTNADFLLVSVGVFDNPGQWLADRLPETRPARSSGHAPAPGWPAEPAEEASVGRGKTYYHFAYSYSQQINRRHPAITDVLEKLSVGFDRYIKILSHMRGEYMDLVDMLSKGEVYHLERNVDKERERECLRQMQDDFLDCYIEWKRTSSPEAADKLRRAAALVQASDPDFKFTLNPAETPEKLTT